MRIPKLLTVLALVLPGLGLLGGEGGFTATLSQAEQTATGVSDLTIEEQAALNALVAGEVALARQGAITGFAGTFSSRRKPEERGAAGLDQLSADQIAQLNALVAALIASGPVVPTLPAKLTSKDVTRNDRFETHGEISFMYGWGSGGGTMRGASFYTDVFDRETGISVGIGISRFEGDGFQFYDNRHYGSSIGTPFPIRGVFVRPTNCRPR